jgi:hypothetical protein
MSQQTLDNFEMREIEPIRAIDFPLYKPFVDGEYGLVIYVLSRLAQRDAAAFYDWRYAKLYDVMEIQLVQRLPNGDRLYRLNVFPCQI